MSANFFAVFLKKKKKNEFAATDLLLFYYDVEDRLLLGDLL